MPLRNDLCFKLHQSHVQDLKPTHKEHLRTAACRQATAEQWSFVFFVWQRGHAFVPRRTASKLRPSCSTGYSARGPRSGPSSSLCDFGYAPARGASGCKQTANVLSSGVRHAYVVRAMVLRLTRVTAHFGLRAASRHALSAHPCLRSSVRAVLALCARSWAWPRQKRLYMALQGTLNVMGWATQFP